MRSFMPHLREIHKSLSFRSNEIVPVADQARLRYSYPTRTRVWVRKDTAGSRPSAPTHHFQRMSYVALGTSDFDHTLPDPLTASSDQPGWRLGFTVNHRRKWYGNPHQRSAASRFNL